WKTIRDTAAVSVSSNQTWTWKVPIVDVTGTSVTLPTNVTFALRYDSSAGTFWDNNSPYGSIQNYVRTLAPQCYISSIDNSVDLNGLFNVETGCYSDLPFTQPPQFRLDNNQFQTTYSYFLNTTALSNGPHVAEVQAYLPGSKVVAGDLKLNFNVKNAVKFVDQWAPLGASTSAWDVITDDTGAVYIGAETGVYKFAKYGDAAPVQNFTGPLATGFMNNIALDDSKNLYILTSSLSKFLANGNVDTTFGTNGSVSFGQTSFGSTSFCYPGYMNVVGGYILISDTCNERIVKLSISTGAFVDEFTLLKTGDFGILSSISKSPRGNFVVSREVYNQPNMLFEIRPADFGIVGSLQLDTHIGSIAAFSVTATKWFITSNFDNSVFVIDAATGKTLGKWNGNGGVDGTPGHMDPIRGSILLSDGTVAAMSVTGAALQRFSQTLLV
ncbi:hypothetical protein HDU76_007531, partial [Blyttiomyces sp. JEL0837]